MSIIDKILEVKKEEIKKLRADYSISRFKDSEFFDKKKKSISESLSRDNNISIIAEIKKASPSKGIIKNDFDHKKIAEIYLRNRVNGISILTDKIFFKGDIKYLNDIADYSDVPLLRKDFIIDEYQILETKSNGADAILLISEVLSENQIRELTHAAIEINLEVLLELHSVDQISKIDFEMNKLIGINNRNLSDFSVNINSTAEIAKILPKETLIVSESGIKTAEDINSLKETNTQAILVGEHLMRSNNIGESLSQLIKWCKRES